MDVSQICVEEKKLIGSYSASIELQAKAAELIFSRTVKVAGLVTHRFGLDQVVGRHPGLAGHPSQDSLKVMIRP